MLMPGNIDKFTDDMEEARVFDSDVKKTFTTKIKPKARGGCCEGFFYV